MIPSKDFLPEKKNKVKKMFQKKVAYLSNQKQEKRPNNLSNNLAKDFENVLDRPCPIIEVEQFLQMLFE